jgi:hypothetical protein
MKKEEKLEVLDFIEDVLTRCQETMYIPHPDGGGEYKTYVDPELAYRVVRNLKETIYLEKSR